MHSTRDSEPPPTINNSMEMTKHWLSTQVPDGRADHQKHPIQQNLTLNLTETDRPRTPTTLIPITPQFMGQVLTPTIGVAGIQLSASPNNSFPSLVQPFQFSKQTQFVSSFDPQVSSDAPTGANAPRFLLIKSDISPDDYNKVTWTPTNEYNIILTGPNQNLQQLHQQHQQQQQQQQQLQLQLHSELPSQKWWTLVHFLHHIHFYLLLFLLFVWCFVVCVMLFVCCLYVVCIVVMYHCLHDVVVAKVIIV